MKISRPLALSLVLFAGSLVETRHGSVAAAPPGSSLNPGAYDIGLEVSQAADRTTWRYTITKRTADTKDLGHFILDLASCGAQSPTLANIVSATVDGVDWSGRLEASEGITGCDVTS